MTSDQYRREGAEAMREAIALGFVGHVRENVRRTPLPADTTALDRLTAPDAEAVTMTYRNWRGEVGKRTIVPLRVWFGATEWHPEPGWLLSALDMEKGVERDFALADCQFSDLTPAPDAVAGRPCTDCGQTHDTDGDLCPTCVCVRAEIAAMENEQCQVSIEPATGADTYGPRGSDADAHAAVVNSHTGAVARLVEAAQRLAIHIEVMQSIGEAWPVQTEGKVSAILAAMKGDRP